MSSKEIIIRSNIVAKKSSDIRQVTRKAVAGLSEAELIERHSIGIYEEEEEEGRETSKKD